jgi:hypothetical protein
MYIKVRTTSTVAMQVMGHLRTFCPSSIEGKPLTLITHGQTVDRGVGRMYVAPVVGPCYICCSGAVLIVAHPE